MIRAYVHEDVLGMHLSISVVMHPEQGSLGFKSRVLHLRGEGRTSPTWDEIEDGAVTEPTLTLDHEQARAVLDALSRAFDGAEDTRALRRDYDAERQRVDRLAGTLSSLALKLAEPA